MSEENFRPLVDAPDKGFQASEAPRKSLTDFAPLQFRCEEAPETPFESAQPEPKKEPPQVEAEPAPKESFSPMDSPEEVAVESEPRLQEPDPGILAVERQAFDMGFEKGEREGLMKGEERAMEMLVRLENLIMGFEGAWRRSCLEREETLVKLALSVVENVVMARAERDDEMAARSLVEALASMEEPGRCTVRVNPDDFSSVERLRADLFQRIANLQEITILPDPVVEGGEVRLESEGGWLETSARTRLDEVMARMEDAAGIEQGAAGVA